MEFKRNTNLDIIKAMMIKSNIDKFYLTEQEIREAGEYEIYKIKCNNRFGSVYNLVKKELRLKE